MGHQLSKSDAWVIDLGADPVDDFTQVVRWDIGGHADGNAGAAVDQQVWERRGKNRGLGLGFIIVRDEIDRVLVHVIHQHGAQWREPGFGVPHGRWRIAFDGTEVPLSVQQSFAHGPRLRHVNERRINGLIAVGMVITHGFADDLGALDVLAIGHHSEIVHGEKNPSLGRFQAIAHVGQCARNDHGHRVIKKRILDLVGDVNFYDLFVGSVR